jgi:hypothetical protein
VIVVAHGAGGMRGGAIASDAIIEPVRDALAVEAFDLESDDAWKYVFHQKDIELAKKMSVETTAVVVVRGRDRLMGVSVGDSEAWIVRPTDIDDLTVGENNKRLGGGRAASTRTGRSSQRSLESTGLSPTSPRSSRSLCAYRQDGSTTTLRSSSCARAEPFCS